MKALIVDDSPYMRTQLKNLLGDMSFETAQAADGKAALEKLEDGFDLIVLDIVMDDMDGIQFLQELQDMDVSPAVVVVSALLEEPMREKAKALGVEHFVDKPFEDDDLEAVIEEAVEG